MILLKEITTSSVFYPDAEKLLLDAFPPEERRPVAHQRIITDTNRQFQAQAIICNFDFAGILNIWHLANATYIEHLAVLPALRNQGIASQALRALQKRSNKPIILEVEPAVDPVTVARISFYERNGFKIENTNYIQPPYSINLPPVRLHIMTYGQVDNITDVINDIKSTVYGLDM